MGNRWGVDINRNQIERNNDAARARKFRNSIRGKYILSQSLSIAIKYLKGLEERDDPYPKYGTHAEPSNREDMEYLFQDLYPMYGTNPKSLEVLEQIKEKGE